MATQPVSTAGAAAGATPTQPHLREKHLTTLHAIGAGPGHGPIFSVGLVSGVVATAAGFSTPASIVLGSIGSIGLAYVIAVYARRYAGAGAIFEYLSHAVHNSFGIFSGSVCLLGTLFLGAGAIYIGLGFLSRGSSRATSIPRSSGESAELPASRSRHAQPLRRQTLDPGRPAAGLDLVDPFLFLSVVIVAKDGVGGNTLGCSTQTRLRGTPCSTASCSR
jgi:amino acid transporter